MARATRVMVTSTKRAMATAAIAMATATKRAKAARAMAKVTKREMMAVRAMAMSMLTATRVLGERWQQQ
jgi:hypothetical protein